MNSPDTTPPRLRRRSDGTEYVLGAETLLGRSLECDIVVSDGDSISRRHARVEVDDDTLFVTDLGSTNGTHVNGREVIERTALHDGDVLAFDEFEFDVLMPPPPDPEATRIVSREEVLARIAEPPADVTTRIDVARAASTAPDRDTEADRPAGVGLDEAARRSALDGDVPLRQGRHETPATEPSSSPAEASPVDPRPPFERFDEHLEERSDNRAVNSSDLPEAREPAGPAAARPTGRDGSNGARNSRSVADEMADDEWTWPDLDDGFDESDVEFTDESPSPVEPSGVTPRDAGRERVRASDSGPSVEPAPVVSETPSDDDFATRMPPDATPHATPRDPDPFGARLPDAGASDPLEIDSGRGDGLPPRDGRTASDAAALEFDDLDHAPPDVAPLPRSWADTSVVRGTGEHTKIFKGPLSRSDAPSPIDPASVDGPALVITSGNFAGEVLDLDTGGPEWIVGSSPESDLHIRNEGVSTLHAVLSREGRKWRIRDELSANHTFVNDKRVNAGFVGDGDRLRFGPIECQLVLPKAKRGKASDRKGRHRGEPSAGRGRDERPRRGGGFPWKTVGAVVIALAVGAAAAVFVLSTRA